MDFQTSHLEVGGASGTQSLGICRSHCDVRTKELAYTVWEWSAGPRHAVLVWGEQPRTMSKKDLFAFNSRGIATCVWRLSLKG